MATLFKFPSYSYSSPHNSFSFTLPSKIYTSRIPKICALLSNNNKSRVRKKVKSNEDLCNEIREFTTQLRFPDHHLPSFKELSDHGRQDLAYIVRRRGYKLIKELLATKVVTKTVESDLAGQNGKATTVNRNQQDEVEDLVEAVKVTNEFHIGEDGFNGVNHISAESSAKSSLQEKVAKFIQKGELDAIEDSGFDILSENSDEETDASVEYENTTEQESNSNESNAAKVLNRSASLSQQVEPSTSENGITRENCYSADGLSNADSNEDLEVETRKMENEVEISRLKFMLHQKELELSELKQQIKKEKHLLSLLQTKADEEISTAKKLVSDKDAELHEAEEALSGLEEVQIQYRGDGESVEVAGSFNGWHQRIKMDPQPASSIMDPMRARSSGLWRTLLWLYPGTYEIKFIVDGHWRTDPERELVIRGSIHNNILRVNRK